MSELAAYCYGNNKFVPLSRYHHVVSIEDAEFYYDKRFMANLLDFEQNISLNEGERGAVEAFLRERNVTLPEKYICFFNRDRRYLKVVGVESVNSVRHDYRNSSIGNYIPAMRKMYRKGIHCIRLGVDVEVPIENENGIIDCSDKFDNEALQFYLIEKAKFIVGTTSGLAAACKVFRKSMAYVNVSPLVTLRLVPKGNDLFIPKKYWSRAHERFLRFREIIEGGLGEIYSTEEFNELGIDIMENSEDEITGLVEEMELRVSNEWVTSEREVFLREKFYKILAPLDIRPNDMPAIGTSFLIDNEDLL